MTMWLLFSLLATAQAAPWPLRGKSVGAVPHSFDCGMRQLAYDYGRQLLPRLGKFESLWYALGLTSDGSEGGCKGGWGTVDPPPFVSEELLAESLIFVDPVSGHDHASGSKEEPVRSIQLALDRAPRGGTVVLRQGTHFLTDTLRLSAEHSGVTITNHPGELPVVSGGKKLAVNWKPAKGPRGDDIYVADIQGQVEDVPGLHLNGVRATRARYPNLDGGVEVSPGYGGMISSDANPSNAKWTPPQFDKFGPPKFFTDSAHTRNNTPDNWFQHYMVGIGGLCSVYDPPVSYWCSENPSGGGAFAFRTPSGVTPKAGVLPNSPYKDASQAQFFVWRPNRWANWMFEIADYDATTNNFTFGRGGNQGARGENTGGDWFVENVWEELDHPGEFFFDRKSGQLYLFHNGTGAPPADVEVVAPQFQVLLNATGTQWNPVKNVTIRGIHFTASAYTYMMPHGVPSGGDWALERFGAVFLQGTESVTISNCTFERLDGHGVMISGYNRNVTIADSDFGFIGGSAMASWGFTNETSGDGHPGAGVDGTDGNHPRYTSVLRNLVHEVGLYEKQNSFYVQAKTAQTTIIGNVFFNGPRAGVNFNDGFGGGDELAHNLIFSTCRESGDHGPFNSWDRQPFLTTVRTGEPSLVMAQRVIHHNFLIDNYSPQEDVDNDDGSNYFWTHHNFLVYGGNGMKNDFGGHDNHHTDNVYAYVGQALSVCPMLDGHE
ncbi:unnamed protein product, partial [Polarella glacialis]